MIWIITYKHFKHLLFNDFQSCDTVLLHGRCAGVGASMSLQTYYSDLGNSAEQLHKQAGAFAGTFTHLKIDMSALIYSTVLSECLGYSVTFKSCSVGGNSVSLRQAA